MARARALHLLKRAAELTFGIDDDPGMSDVALIVLSGLSVSGLFVGSLAAVNVISEVRRLRQKALPDRGLSFTEKSAVPSQLIAHAAPMASRIGSPGCHGIFVG
jgi:hypothetical protein